MAKILLIHPSFETVYNGSRMSVVHSFYPPLSLATIAAVATMYRFCIFRFARTIIA